MCSMMNFLHRVEGRHLWCGELNLGGSSLEPANTQTNQYNKQINWQHINQLINHLNQYLLRYLTNTLTVLRFALQ